MYQAEIISSLTKTMTKQNQRVSESQEFKLSLNDEWTYQGNNRRSVEILCYKGKAPAPGWLDEDPGELYSQHYIASLCRD